MNVQSGLAEVNDTCLYYEVAGTGPPLVLIHGFTLDTRMWDDQFEAFSKHHRVVRYDLRGYGQSALPVLGEGYSHADDLRALLDHLGARARAHARVLALQGADVIVVPTNWPELTEFIPEYIIPTRARENRVFCVAINRVGEERGSKFIGRSKIAHFLGNPLAEGKPYEEDVLYVEIEPATAREKHVVVSPGEFEVHLINDRRPEFYAVITQPLADTSRIR